MTKPTLKNAHYLSGILLIFFILGHLLNHAMIFVSVEAHLQFMDAYRKIYRFPPVEFLLLGAVLFQVTSGTRLIWLKWRHVESVWDRLQIVSGMYFIYFLIVHPGAVMFGRYVLDLDTNLYFGAAVLNVKPLLYFFVFHYGLAIVAFFTHIACVHRKRMDRYCTIQAATYQSMLMMGLGVVLALLLVYHMMGIRIPSEYLTPFGGGL